MELRIQQFIDTGIVFISAQMWQQYERRAIPALCEPIMRSPMMRKRSRSEAGQSGNDDSKRAK